MVTETILLGCILFICLINTVIQVGNARNTARLVQNELDKMELEADRWHARNVTYKDAHMANEAPPSDGLNIAHFRS